MIDDFEIQDLVPHSGTMSLLTRVTAYGDEWLEAEVDIHHDSVFVEAAGVPSWVGIEYLAQAIAAFSGLQERKQYKQPKLGFLLGTRRYDVNTEWFAMGQTLHIRVEQEMVAENGLHVFRGRLTANHIEASANMNVFQPEDASQFIKEKSV